MSFYNNVIIYTRCCNANHTIELMLQIFKNDFYSYILQIQEIMDTNVVKFYSYRPFVVSF
jgi:hypothetical protein